MKEEKGAAGEERGEQVAKSRKRNGENMKIREKGEMRSEKERRNMGLKERKAKGDKKRKGGT